MDNNNVPEMNNSVPEANNNTAPVMDNNNVQPMNNNVPPMNNAYTPINNYNIPSQYQPLSPWAYFGYQILFTIPFIGFILLIVFALSNDNINRRNFARSYFCMLILVVILIVILFVLGISIGGLNSVVESA